MARNPEIEVLDTDVQALVDEWTARFEEIMGYRVVPASPAKLFILSVVLGIIQERVLTNYAINQCIPSRAEGANLDGLAELFFAQKRRLATPAHCTIKFTISEAQASAVLIPGGTRVTDADRAVYWETEQDNYILPGETELEVPVLCQVAGASGNGWKPGTIFNLVDIFDYYLECSNTTESDGGSDAMTDEELYEAMVLSMDALSTAGPTGSYIYHAKTVSSEIADVSACTPEPGVVSLFAIGPDGEPVSKELQDQILEACSADNVRPMTDLVRMEDPELVEYNIDFTYYTPRSMQRGSGTVEAAVNQAVADFEKWQCGHLGRDINPSQLIYLLKQTGIKRVELREPEFTRLEDGQSFDSETEAEFKKPQLAKIKSIKVINGGFENE